jgi:hypothetical protein
VAFDEADDIDAWPQAEDRGPLGFMVVPLTRDGGGGVARDRVAPFVRAAMDEPRPAVRPSPAAFWGATHQTTLRFAPRRDLTPPKVKGVTFIGSSGNEPAAFKVAFDKPVSGYPVSALSSTVTEPSSYRFVVGNLSERRVREAYEAADPRQSGMTPSLGVELDDKDPYVVYVRDTARRFEGYTRFKFFVAPRVEDVFGAAVGGDGYVVEGNL